MAAFSCVRWISCGVSVFLSPLFCGFFSPCFLRRHAFYWATSDMYTWRGFEGEEHACCLPSKRWAPCVPEVSLFCTSRETSPMCGKREGEGNGIRRHPRMVIGVRFVGKPTTNRKQNAPTLHGKRLVPSLGNRSLAGVTKPNTCAEGALWLWCPPGSAEGLLQSQRSTTTPTKA